MFNILNKETDVHSGYVLEASAGTGKTFSIENIVTRLLLEDENIQLENILLITFTRAAARDLKKRVRRNLERILQLLQKENREESPDYLLPHFNNQSIKKIQESLFVFDQANIYTIHGFCFQSLSENLLESSSSLKGVVGDRSEYDEILQNVSKDFIRTSLSSYSYQQVKKVLKSCRGSFKELEKKLKKYFSDGNQLLHLPKYEELFIQFQDECEKFSVRSEQVVEDFQKQYPNYKKHSDDALEAVERMSIILQKNHVDKDDLEILIKEGLVYIEALDPSRLKKNKMEVDSTSLHYPDLRSRLKMLLEPIINQVSDPHYILYHMIVDSKTLLSDFLKNEEKILFDDLLRMMKESSNNPLFAKSLREKYKSVIVDEFQDTDPLQWEILDTLFGRDWNGKLSIVGDPKQSIYAFRQADIYTYIKASNSLKAAHKATLGVNYRSHPPLVSALNALFSVEDLFPLPRTKEALSCLTVETPNREEKEFSDAMRSLVFWHVKDSKEKKYPLEEYEELFFFPMITNELINLHRNDQFSWKSFAILVRDRFQGERTSRFLSKQGIPCQKIRATDQSQQVILEALQHLMEAVLFPKNLNKVKIALGGILIGWDSEKILLLKEESILENLMEAFFNLRRIWFNKGFLPFVEAFFQLRLEEKSVAENLLHRKEGEVLYHQLLAYTDAIVRHQIQKNETPEGLLFFVEYLKTSDSEFVKGADAIQDDNLVKIMTLHASKGLEFDVVFPIGLLNRTPQPDRIIPIKREDGSFLKPVVSLEDPDYLLHCQEVDAEKMRQLYVALTRAKYRIYLPYCEFPLSQPKPATASPMELFAEKYRGDLATFCQSQPELFTYLEVSPLEPNFYQEEKSVSLVVPDKVVIPGEEKYVYSFTSLSRRHSAGTSLVAPHRFNVEEKTEHTLPAGSQTGILLHSLLERIDLNRISTVDLIRNQVVAMIDGGEFTDWAEVLTSMIYCVFHMSLGRDFTLSQLDKKSVFREIEFIYPSEGGYLKGIIDFVCRIEGKYYLFDWKSNWLGPSSENYREESLLQAMEENDYKLQAKFYREALERYLELFNGSKDEIGGVCYLFLRGVNSGKGVFWV